MPRLDFEKQFARQLKDRELKPSEGSWEKLQGKLEVQEKKSSFRSWWIGIAATIIGAFILFNFFGSSPVIEGTPAVVNENQNVDPGQNNSVEQVAVEEPEGDSETVPVRSGVALPKVTRETTPLVSNTEAAGSAEPGEIIGAKKKEVSEVEVSAAVASQEEAGGIQISDAEINALLEKAMAEVSQETGGKTEVTDAEIEVLLASARAAVRKDQGQFGTATLSPDQLLMEVEAGLDHSFRAKVFEIIKDGLRKTRNAVANINE